MHAGPGAETRTVQKIISVACSWSLAAMIVVSALDFRFGWSSVPAAVPVVGDVLVAVGLGIVDACGHPEQLCGRQYHG